MTPDSSPPPGSPADPVRGDVTVLELLVLGTPVLRYGEQEVRFRTRKAFGLLVYLALSRIPQSREQLATLLWPDHEEAAARTLLRTTLSQLRHQLAEAGSTSTEAITLLQAERDALGREVVGIAREGIPALRVDVELLEAATSHRGEGADAEAQLQAAAAAYRGPFLEGVRFEDAPELEEWVSSQRVWWQGQIEGILERLATLQLGRRGFAEAIETARRWLSLNRLSEPAYQAVMRALAGAGDRAGALSVYQECRSILQTELSVEPSPETVALAGRLRQLPTSSPREAAPRQPAGAWPVVHHAELPFVGREREFAALVAAYQAARSGQLQVVVIEGEAGIGKTRLTEEFVRWATVEGADVLRARGDDARARLPYQLGVDAVRPRLARENAPEDLVADVWLIELVRLFPELRERYPDLPAPMTLSGDEATGQGRLFEAVLQLTLALAERARPAALVLWYDDVQWADLATRYLLLYRLPRQREMGTPQLLLLTVRSEAPAMTPDLESWLVTLARQVPTTRLALGPLARTETEQAIAAVLADPSVANGALGLGRWLYAQSEGQPFYLVETLHTLVDRGILVPREGVAGSDQVPRFAIAAGVDRLPRFVPGTVHELIRGQLGGLSPPALEELAAVAVLGTEATFEHLCQLAELDERAGLAALDELGSRRLVVEEGGDPDEPVGPARFGFPHDLVREVVYTEAGDTRRRIFHRRAFALLEGTTASPADLARHALMAGLVEPAFRSSVVAGDAALAVFAARDAIGHYQQAQRLLAGPDAGQSPITTEQWAHLHLQLGVAYEWAGEWEQARTTFAALRRHAREAHNATLEGRALTRLAFLSWFDVHDMAAARTLVAEAIGVLDATEDRELLAEAHWAASVLGDLAGEPEVAHTHAQRAEELARAMGRRELVAESLFLQGLIAFHSGDWDESITAFQHGGALYAELAAEQAARLPGRGAGETPQHVALFPWMGLGDATGYLVSEALCVAEEGLAAICRGEPHRGLELGHKALRLGLESANAAAEELARYGITTGLVEVGYYEEALQVGRPGLQRTPEPGEPTFHLWMVASWAWAQQGILDLEEAELAVAEALERAEQLAIAHWTLRPLSLQCATLALAGDWTGAFDSALQAVSLRETLEARLQPLDFARHYESEALVRGGNLALAQADVRRLGERLRGDGSDRRYWLVYHRMQAVLVRWNGRPAEAITNLKEALQLAQEMGLPGEEWQIAAELAAAYRRGGALAETEEALERARAVIASLARGIKDQRLRDRFQAAALERVQLLAS